MKKFMVIVLTVLFAAGFCMPSFAAKKAAEKKFDRIVAEVVSIDAAAKTMVVKREENGESRTVSISEKAASKLQVGDRVRIKLKAGTNESAGVRILGAKPVAEDAAAEPEARSAVK
jgi:ribosomal protein S17